MAGSRLVVVRQRGCAIVSRKGDRAGMNGSPLVKLGRPTLA